MIDFDALWQSGAWRKIGKDAARKRFRATVKNYADERDILLARDAYNAHCAANRWYTPVLGSVWFGSRKGWRDWVPDRVELLEDEAPLLAGIHEHWCRYCEPAHAHACEMPEICGMTRDVACPQFAARYSR